MAPSVKCVFCLKSVFGHDELNDDQSLGKCREITAKFFRFLQLHLNSDIHHVNQESPASLLIEGVDACENISLDIDSCSDCNQLMSHFIDLYNQLKLIELKIKETMHCLVTVMSSVAKVPSKVKAFNDSLKSPGSYDEEEERIKLQRIHNFRLDLITKCNNHSGLLPRGTLDQHKINSIKAPLEDETLPKIPITEEVVITNEPDTDFNSEPEPCLSDTDMFPDSCEDEEKSATLSKPLKFNRRKRNPIATTCAKATTISSSVRNSRRKRVIRARKRLSCDKCSKSFATPSALLKHQRTSHNEPIGVTDDEGNNDSKSSDCDMNISCVEESEVKNKKTVTRRKGKKRTKYSDSITAIDALVVTSETTDQEIIQHYANTQLEFVRGTTNQKNRGYFVVQTESESLTTPDNCIKTLSQYLSPAQQRLTAALLHRPKFLCKFDKCIEKFVFEDDLTSHSKLHGEFSCGVCSHVETYAPQLAKHVLTEHCIKISGNKIRGLFVTCPVPTCPSDPQGYHQTHYVFHYLTQHLNLDVSSMGCLICHYIHQSGLLSTHNHFQYFHGIFNMKPERVLQCESCPAFFCSDWKLNMHKLAFHNQVPTSCPYCQKTVNGTNAYGIHRNVCQGINTDLFQHSCSFPNCNKSFAYMSHLVRHRKNCTFNPEITWHDCSKCKSRFPDEEQLQRHLEYHERPKKSYNYNNYNKGEFRMCEVCGKQIAASWIRNHMKQHEGPDSWKHECPECGKKSSCASKLATHMRMHTKECPFICQFCGAKYAQAQSLRLHLSKKHDYTTPLVPKE